MASNGPASAAPSIANPASVDLFVDPPAPFVDFDEGGDDPDELHAGPVATLDATTDATSAPRSEPAPRFFRTLRKQRE